MAARRLLRLAGLLCVLLAGLVFAAGSAYAASAPVIKRVWASEVNRSTARINAEVNPSEADTTYRFEYGPDASYGSSVPVPNADLGSTTETVEVGQLLTGLQAGGTYHYRIVATNSQGTTTGEDESFTTFPASVPQPADTCPNAVYRVGFSAGLPDCRAYELVSPVEKNGADITAEAFGQTFASETGDLSGEVDRAVFMTKTAFGETSGSGSVGITQYLAERRPDGWVSRGITPRPYAGNGGQILFYKTDLMEFSPDLSIAGVLGYSLPEGPPTARPNSENLYVEDTTNSRLLAAVTDASHEGESPFPPQFLEIFPESALVAQFGKPVLGGASSSLNVVTFMSRMNYVTEAKGFNNKAYVYEHGEVKLLGYLPHESTPAPGGSKLIYAERDFIGYQRDVDRPAIALKDTVSTDGTRILFEVNERPGQIFMRKNGTTSVNVTESETSEPVEAKNVELYAATPDLKHIVFTSTSKLTEDASEFGGIYMYTDGPNPESESNLTYIVGNEGLGTEEFHPVPPDPIVSVSDDGTHVYYETSIATGGYGLGLWDAGHTRQVFPAPGSTGGYGLEPRGRTTPNGHLFAFSVKAGEWTERASGYKKDIQEMYVYNEDTGSVKCVSCPVTGAAPTVGIDMGVHADKGPSEYAEPYRPHFMSHDGRFVFFNTVEALVPQDTNGVTDAYEYDTVTGQLSLLSSGTGEDGTWFVDASGDGHDALLVTRQKLTRWDPDKLVDVYDARLEGGLPEPPLPALPCDGDACQGTPSAAPSFNVASGFSGLGNPSFTTAVRVKSKAKPNVRLRHALAVCRKKPKRKQAGCERVARKRYGRGRSAVVRTGRAGR